MKNKKDISPEKKFRLTVFIVTAVLCVAIVALGILYVSKLRMRTNAESSDNTTTEQTVSTEPITSAVSETTENTDELIQPQESNLYLYKTAVVFITAVTPFKMTALAVRERRRSGSRTALIQRRRNPREMLI